MAKYTHNNKKQVDVQEIRKPWLKMKSATLVLTAVSILLAVIVAYQIIRGSGDWDQGILWGVIFGGSVWLVFVGMNWFHSIFRGKK